MIHDALLTTDDLLQATGFERPGDLTRLFDQQGIRWFPGSFLLPASYLLDPPGNALVDPDAVLCLGNRLGAATDG